jgi:hypothetical protein
LKVAHHIFHRCLRAPAMLRPKAVLLVTHNLQLVPQADTVCLLADRRAAYVGHAAAFLKVTARARLRDADMTKQLFFFFFVYVTCFRYGSVFFECLGLPINPFL